LARLTYINPGARRGKLRSMKSFYFALVLLALLGACDREGPAERAGEKIDRAAEDVRDAVKDATN
jgi:hypothetical protein